MIQTTLVNVTPFARFDILPTWLCASLCDIFLNKSRRETCLFCNRLNIAYLGVSQNELIRLQIYMSTSWIGTFVLTTSVFWLERFISIRLISVRSIDKRPLSTSRQPQIWDVFEVDVAWLRVPWYKVVQVQDKYIEASTNSGSRTWKRISTTTTATADWAWLIFECVSEYGWSPWPPCNP